MKINLQTPAFLLIVIIISSCISQNTVNHFPVPESGIYEAEKPVPVERENIIETKSGAVGSIPLWLSAYLDGGIEAVEKLEAYSNKFVFIAINEGVNFTALKRWEDFFSTSYDFPVLAAVRIERRMYLTASLYPDDEYGAFFETMTKNAYRGIYPGILKEDTYWIKARTNNDNIQPLEEYIFFILVTADRTLMQNYVRNMMSVTVSSVTLTAAQNSAVNRLRQTFFEGF
ncbi:MAG: hypothetical protein FWD22_01755 [Treponema sp.]|nr:hypothetical protein [Treponema sp.]